MKQLYKLSQQLEANGFASTNTAYVLLRTLAVFVPSLIAGLLLKNYRASARYQPGGICYYFLWMDYYHLWLLGSTFTFNANGLMLYILTFLNLFFFVI